MVSKIGRLKFMSLNSSGQVHEPKLFINVVHQPSAAAIVVQPACLDNADLGGLELISAHYFCWKEDHFEFITFSKRSFQSGQR